MAGIHAGAENSFCHSKNFLGAKLDAEFSLATLETVQAYQGREAFNIPGSAKNRALILPLESFPMPSPAG